MSAKNKNSYNIFRNLCFLLNEQRKCIPFCLILCIGNVFFSLGFSIVEIWLPKQVVYDITQHSTQIQIITNLSLLGFILIVCNLTKTGITNYEVTPKS